MAEAVVVVVAASRTESKIPMQMPARHSMQYERTRWAFLEPEGWVFLQNYS